MSNECLGCVGCVECAESVEGSCQSVVISSMWQSVNVDVEDVVVNKETW